MEAINFYDEQSENEIPLSNFNLLKSSQTKSKSSNNMSDL